jgi:hypothetical protein
MSSLTYIPGFSVKFWFGLIWFWGFRGKDLNVKVYDVRRMPSDGKSSHDLWPGELKMFILYTSVDT